LITFAPGFEKRSEKKFEKSSSESLVESKTLSTFAGPKRKIGEEGKKGTERRREEKEF